VFSAHRDLEAAHALLLLDAPGVGPRKFLQLLTKYESAQEAVAYLRAAENTTIPVRIREFAQNTPLNGYIDRIERTRRLGGRYKLWSDTDYPSNLSQWDGRPPVLFYKGDLSCLTRRSLALVGRVDPTDEGLAAADRFARKCADHGIAVISGLAKGIDGASHRASLCVPQGHTYAVVGHGLDHAYPRDNLDLYATIPSRGAIISQFVTGTGPQRWTFPARNEVMCTLALGTVIIEGKPGCGSIIQADFSFKHDRPVFVLGRNLANTGSEWAEELVARGAHVIERFDQVLRIISHTMNEWQTQDSPQYLSEQPYLFGTAPETENLVTTPMSDADYPHVAVLFDLDGVVVDTRAATAEALASLATTELGRTIDPRTVDVTIAPHRALSTLGVADAYNVYRQRYDAAFEQAGSSVQVFDEVVAGLRDLKNVGVRLGAVTAQPLRRVRVMLPERIAKLFDCILAHTDTQGKKDIGISKALRRMNVKPEHGIYIGDTPGDLDAARLAGVKGVGVLWGFSTEAVLRQRPHDLILRDTRQIGHGLLDILRN